MKPKKTLYPATKVVHWSTGPVNACDEHAAALVRIANHLGFHVGVTDATPLATCKNCENEHKEASDETP